MTIREAWQNTASTIDRGGMPAWIATSVLGWIIFWPLGAFLLFNAFMRRREIMWKHAGLSQGELESTRARGAWCANRRGFGPSNHNLKPSGNVAFDKYREETLNRLEEERQAFSDYLDRLRASRDQEEFEGWMKEYNQDAEPQDDQGTPARKK